MKLGVNDGENICARGETILRVGRLALIKLSFSLRSLIAGKEVGGASGKAGGHWADGSRGSLPPLKPSSAIESIFVCVLNTFPPSSGDLLVF